MTGDKSTYVCPFCRHVTDPVRDSCVHCGVGVNVRVAHSASEWLSQPPIRDMARIQFGASYCQIEGVQVPIADFNLAGSEPIYFSHHHLLWADPSIILEAKPMAGVWNRLYAGMPLVMLQAGGPGHIALSDDHPGEVIAVVLEHRFLAATDNVEYRWKPSGLWYYTQKRDDREQHFPLGRFLDVFRSGEGPGLLLLHAPGNTFVRQLEPGQSICVQPSALVYADPSVHMQLHIEVPSGAREMYMRPGAARMLHFAWLRLLGPGRVAIQSIFNRPEATGPPVNIWGSGSTSTSW
jgi:uncharacterized protein (AIM24 family)